MILTRLLKHDITYWSLSSRDGWNNPTFGTYDSIKGHWVDRQELYKTKEGEEKVSRSVIYLDQTVTQGGYLYFGNSTSSDPTSVSGAFEIQAVEKHSNIRGDMFLYKVYL